MTEPYECDVENVGKFITWLSEGGINVWEHINNPSIVFACPAIDGELPENFKLVRHITKPSEVVVLVPKELSRVKTGFPFDNDLDTIEENNKIRTIFNDYKKQYKRVWYEFDKPECIFFTTESETLLTEWKVRKTETIPVTPKNELYKVNQQIGCMKCFP